MYILSIVQNQPFLKLLTMLVELTGGPPGMPPFMNYVLQKFWEVSSVIFVSVKNYMHVLFIALPLVFLKKSEALLLCGRNVGRLKVQK